METPNRILEFNTLHCTPKNESKQYKAVKYGLWFVAVVCIVMHVILGESIFTQLPLSAKVTLLVAVVYVFKEGGTQKELCRAKLEFFDEYMIYSRPYCYYSKTNIRKECNKLYYKDIKRWEYNPVTGRMDVMGIIEETFYSFNKSKELQKEPSFHKTVDSIVLFYTKFNPEINFISEIETNTPIKVKIIDT